MAANEKFADIDAYLATVAPESKRILQEIRQLIHRKVPKAHEVISYQMPAFKLSKTFIYFAAFKKHIGIYPPLTVDKSLIALTAPYRNEKGNLAFPLDQLMPFELIARVAVALSKQYGGKPS
jgi:uncharacterized protein YdhG (YjbR/CyaY superfamily)